MEINFDGELLKVILIAIAYLIVRGLSWYFALFRPGEKRAGYLELLEKGIALVNEYRIHYAKKNKGEEAPYPNILEKVKEVSEKLGVVAEDMVAHRRKIKDDRLAWDSLNGVASRTSNTTIITGDTQAEGDAEG